MTKIKTWQERWDANRLKVSRKSAMMAEIAELRAALSASGQTAQTFKHQQEAVPADPISEKDLDRIAAMVPLYTEDTAETIRHKKYRALFEAGAATKQEALNDLIGRLRHQVDDLNGKLFDAQAPQPSQVSEPNKLPFPNWQLAELVSNEDHVDEALRAFSEDPTGDNGVAVILAALTVYAADVHEAARQPKPE